MALLVSKLDSPERTVRRRAIELLVGAGYRATPAQVPLVERVAENADPGHGLGHERPRRAAGRARRRRCA